MKSKIYFIPICRNRRQIMSSAKPKSDSHSRKRTVKESTPAWERTRFFNDPKPITSSLPTVNQNGAVVRATSAPSNPKFVAKRTVKPTPTASKPPPPSHEQSVPTNKNVKGAKKGRLESSSISGLKRAGVRRKPDNSSAKTTKASSDVPDRPVKRARSLEDYAAKLQSLESVKVHIASLASDLIANPQKKIANLKELRTMAVQHKGHLASLVLLTEAQVYKDLIPAYRIRPITEKEAAVKVSKEVLQLRSYEQALLSGYQRFVRSCVSLSRFRAAGNMKTSAAKDMIAVRLAACKAISECLRALPHFNEVDILIHAVCALAADRELEVRKLCCDALASLLADAHKASGTTLSTCVSIAKELSSVAGQKSRIVAEEVVVPLSKINFAGFAKLPSSQKPKNMRKKSKRFDRKLIRNGKVQPDDGVSSDDDDLQKDLAEGDADSTPQEMYAARKSLLDSTCHACFNIVKAASSDVAEDIRKKVSFSARKKPPPALSAALKGLLQLCRFINTDVVEAILAALIPMLRAPRYPLSIRFRTLSAAYAILGFHARSKQSEADAVTSDAREMDTALYISLGGLYSLETRMGEEEDITFDAMEALLSAYSFRKLPSGRAAAIARRVCVWAASAAPTHTCTIGLIKAAQLLLDPTIVAPIFVQKGSEGTEVFSTDAGLVNEYDLLAEDPDVANAMQSAAWELSCLVHHFHPAVRDIVSKCTQGFCGSRLPKSMENIVLTAKGFVSNEGGFNPPPSGQPPQNVRKKIRKTVDMVVEDAVLADVIRDQEARRSFLREDPVIATYLEDVWCEKEGNEETQSIID